MERKGRFEKGNGIRNPYIMTGFVVAVVMFGMAAGMSWGYRADVPVLAITKKDSGTDAGRLADALEYLSETSRFRNAFLEEVDGLSVRMGEEPVSDLSGSERRKLADSILSVSHTGEHVTVTGYADDPEAARDIARTGALSLFRYAAKYYDVDTEADFRIVDEPSVSSRLPNAWILLLGSAILGTLLTALLFSVVPKIRTASRRTPIISMPFNSDIFMPKRPVSPILTGDIDGIGESVPTESGKEEAASDKFFEPEPVRKDAGTEVARSTSKKAPAPTDIPVAMSEEERRFLEEFSFEQPAGADRDETIVSEAEPQSVSEADSEPVAMIDTEKESSVVAAPTRPQTGEESIRKSEAVGIRDSGEPHPVPSREEYLKRLNELLRG
ncbi:MAG: hypothetical protein HGA38_01810 [Candidatus Moranbacteria bacterium]|nr:hypothetical protein [Candidatus Moranbacteria bacterium]